MVRIPISDRSSHAKSAPDRTARPGADLHAATPGSKPRSDQDEDDQVETHNVPDPTASEAGEPEPDRASELAPSDPTVPPTSQPVDTVRYARHSLGATADEEAGGADVAGGERTAPQDADEAAQEQHDQRVGEGEVGRRQQAGEVETQTKDLKPHPSHPGEGLPPNPSGKENSGGSTPADLPGDGAANGSANGASATTTARAATEQDERFLRLAADFENYKKQVARRESEVRDRAVLSVLEDILPVLDNFELAIKHVKTAKDVEQVRVGVEYILQQLRNTLKNYGVEPIVAHGRKFDPLHHDAVEEVADTGQAEGTVVEETQRGYSYKGRVLRPSRVKVAGHKAK